MKGDLGRREWPSKRLLIHCALLALLLCSVSVRCVEAKSESADDSASQDESCPEIVAEFQNWIVNTTEGQSCKATIEGLTTSASTESFCKGSDDSGDSNDANSNDASADDNDCREKLEDYVKELRKAKCYQEELYKTYKLQTSLLCMKKSKTYCYPEYLELDAKLSEAEGLETETEWNTFLEGFCTPCMEKIGKLGSAFSKDAESKRRYRKIKVMCKQHKKTFCYGSAIGALHQLQDNSTDKAVAVEELCDNKCARKIFKHYVRRVMSPVSGMQEALPYLCKKGGSGKDKGYCLRKFGEVAPVYSNDTAELFPDVFVPEDHTETVCSESTLNGSSIECSVGCSDEVESNLGEDALGCCLASAVQFLSHALGETIPEISNVRTSCNASEPSDCGQASNLQKVSGTVVFPGAKAFLENVKPTIEEDIAITIGVEPEAVTITQIVAPQARRKLAGEAESDEGFQQSVEVKYEVSVPEEEKSYVTEEASFLQSNPGELSYDGTEDAYSESSGQQLGSGEESEDDEDDSSASFLAANVALVCTALLTLLFSM